MNNERYSRQIPLPGFGTGAQERLATAKVLVIGAGGLGVPALQYLAGAGVGKIGIVDGDVVSLSNLHRQVIYTPEEVGQSKAALAAQKMNVLNPQIDVSSYPRHLSRANALAIIRNYDLVLDTTDNFAARYLINDACLMLSKPFVYGAVHQYEGHVSVFNFGGGPTYRCLYPTPPSAGQMPDCNSGGVLGVVPGIIGCHQALEAIKMITGIGQTLSGYLQIYDFLSGSQYRFVLKLNPVNQRIAALQESYETASCNSAAVIPVSGLHQWQKEDKAFVLLDVREPEEFAQGSLSGAQNLPLSKMEIGMKDFDESTPLVLYCQKGLRSATAAQLLLRRQPGLQIFELEGGYSGWNAQPPTI